MNVPATVGSAVLTLEATVPAVERTRFGFLPTPVLAWLMVQARNEKREGKKPFYGKHSHGLAKLGHTHTPLGAINIFKDSR